MGLAILTTASTKAETLMALMQSGKELLKPFNTNALLMAFTADLPNAELKCVRTVDILLIDKRSNIYRVTYVTAESLSSCLHAWLFTVLKSEPRVFVSDPYLRYIKQTECQLREQQMPTKLVWLTDVI